MPLALHRAANYSSPVLRGYYGNEHKPYMQGLGDTTVADTLSSSAPLTFFGDTTINSTTPSQLDNIKNFFYAQGVAAGSSGSGFDLSSLSAWFAQNGMLIVGGILALVLIENFTSKGGRK